MLFFFVLRFYNQTIFYYDARNYWELGKSFWESGSFSLMSYPASIRGYLFPLILGFCQYLGHPYFFFQLFSSGIAAFLICILIPEILCAEDEFYSKPRYMAGCFAVLLATVYFWKYLLQFPLSDLPALVLYACSVCLSFRIIKEDTFLKNAIWSFLLGLTLYAAYNIRTVYLIPAVILILFVAAAVLFRKKYQTIPVLVCGCVIGVALLSIPQIIINRNCFGISSPMVQTALGGKSNLFVAQLEWGIIHPRYETFIGDPAVYPIPSVSFEYRAGVAALNGGSISSIGEFIIWVFRNFLLAMGLYWEHFISAVTVFYIEIYLTDIRVNIFAFLLNCGIWMLAFIGLTAKALSIKLREAGKLIPTVFLLFPALLTLPGSIETRFFIPAYLLVYGFLAMKMEYKKTWGFVRSHPVIVGALLFFIMLTWCMAANDILSSVSIGKLTLTGQYIPGG